SRSFRSSLTSHDSCFCSFLSLFSLPILPPPSSTLFPYTTLFRSHIHTPSVDRPRMTGLKCALTLNQETRGIDCEFTIDEPSNLFLNLIGFWGISQRDGVRQFCADSLELIALIS